MSELIIFYRIKRSTLEKRDYFHYLILISLSASYIAEIGQFQNDLYHLSPPNCKVGCVFAMIVVSILPHAELGPNDHRDDEPHFTWTKIPFMISKLIVN